MILKYYYQEAYELGKIYRKEVIYYGYTWKEGKRFTGNESKEFIKNWIGNLNEN